MSVLSSHREVTPYIGVWIEIVCLRPPSVPSSVTPYIGVWIEIIMAKVLAKIDKGHSLYRSVD